MTASATFPTPTNLGTLPSATEGSKAVTFPVRWANFFDPNFATSAGGYHTVFNLLSQYQTGQFTTVQSVYVDNNTNPYEVVLTSLETGQNIHIPPFAEGMYPVATASAPSFNLSLNANVNPQSLAFLLPGTTNFIFFNTPQIPFQNSQLAYGSDFNSFSKNTLFAAAGSGSTNVLLPALSGGNRHYAITSYSVTVMMNGATSLSIPNQTIDLQESLFNPVTGFQNLVRDVFYVPAGTTSGVVYTNKWTFPTPLIQQSPASTLNIVLEVSVGMILSATVTYGILTIQ